MKNPDALSKFGNAGAKAPTVAPPSKPVAAKTAPPPPAPPKEAPPEDEDESPEHDDAADELKELPLMLEASLDAIEASIADMDADLLDDPSLEMSEDDVEQLDNVLDECDPMVREHVRDISWDDAHKVAPEVQGVSDAGALAGWLFRAGQAAGPKVDTAVVAGEEPEDDENAA